MARVRARAVHLHGINTLYHAVSVYTGTHKTLETLETLALRARVSKPVSAVLYIPVYTSTAWYNLYLYVPTSRQMYTVIVSPGPKRGGKGGEAAVSRAILIFKPFAVCAGKREGIVLRAIGIFLRRTLRERVWPA